MNIFVIGFMGSGKSSLGKRLASHMDRPFIDSDKAIVNELGMSIQEIFEQKGEDYFRTYETDWLKRVQDNDSVIALGGGTPCSAENIEIIKSKGLVVYLIVSTPALATRLAASKSIRPLIEDFRDNPEKLKEFINQKVAEREVYYNQANIKFDGESVDSEKLKRLAELISMSAQH